MATLQQIKQAEEAADELMDVAFGTTTPRLNVNSFNEKMDMLQALRATCMKCRACKLGWQAAVRHKMERSPQTFSNMNIAQCAIVGQNPGWDELEGKEPFLGMSGDIFNTELELYNHSRDEFYVTNAVKCFTSCNARPSKQCTRICRSYLQIEFALIRPKLVVALGAVAFEAMCPEMKFSDHVGKIIKSKECGVNIFAIYHPSPISLAVPERKRAFKRQMKVMCLLMDRLNSI